MIDTIKFVVENALFLIAKLALMAIVSAVILLISGAVAWVILWLG